MSQTTCSIIKRTGRQPPFVHLPSLILVVLNEMKKAIHVDPTSGHRGGGDWCRKNYKSSPVLVHCTRRLGNHKEAIFSITQEVKDKVPDFRWESIAVVPLLRRRRSMALHGEKEIHIEENLPTSPMAMTCFPRFAKIGVIAELGEQKRCSRAPPPFLV